MDDVKRRIHKLLNSSSHASGREFSENINSLLLRLHDQACLSTFKMYDICSLIEDLIHCGDITSVKNACLIIPFCSPSHQEIVRLMKILIDNQIDVANQACILNSLCDGFIRDNPVHLYFPGNNESFVQASSLQLRCPEAFSFTMWIKMDPPKITDCTECVLFRITGARLSYECILKKRVSPFTGENSIDMDAFDGSVNLTILLNKEVIASGSIFIHSSRWHLLTGRLEVMRAGELALEPILY